MATELATVTLPPDVVGLIFQELDYKLVGAAASVCKLWARIASQSDAVFAAQFHKEFKNAVERRTAAAAFGSAPYRTMLSALKHKKFLFIHNSPYYESTLKRHADELIKGWGFCTIDCKILPRHTPLQRDEVKELFGRYDAILVGTNYGWQQQGDNDIVGDALKAAAEKGAGAVLTVFTGCSWVETPAGAWRTDNYQPLVPKVEKNNVEGSQQSGSWVKFQAREPSHFLLGGVDSAVSVGCIALGTPHPSGTVVATLDEDIPYVVALENSNASRAVFINAQYDEIPPSLLANALLYVVNTQ